MKVTFTLDSFDDGQEAIDACLKGMDYKLALDELDNWLRGKQKYEDQETIDIDEVRQEIYKICEDI